MIAPILIWWFVSSILGWLAFPIAWRFLNRLPDRGYGLSRALGMLITGYLLWIGCNFGWMTNGLGGAIGSIIILAGISFLAARLHWRTIGEWISSEWKILLSMEVVFALAFVFWSFIRANNAEITYTEKPMELAFLNAILRSDRFPPQDPWLSGYAISYYYFGYIILALMTRLTGVASSVAFNLGNALCFALSILGAYSIVYNLVNHSSKKPRIYAPLLGPMYGFLIGNMEGFFDLLHAKFVFWRCSPTGNLASTFWSWLNLKDLSEPPSGAAGFLCGADFGGLAYRLQQYLLRLDEAQTGNIFTGLYKGMVGLFTEVVIAIARFFGGFKALFQSIAAGEFGLAKIGQELQTWIPTRHLWWWRASRVVNDINLAGDKIEVIDEFPFFSYLLADNHPHLLAIPFVLLAISLTFQIFLCNYREGYPLVTLRNGRKLAMLALPPEAFWPAAWVFGSLAFLNTWDFPIYLSLLLAVILARRLGSNVIELVKRFLLTAIGLVLGGVMFFLPWYPGFRSQAGGILPNILFPTRLPQFLVMFAPLFIPLAIWLIKKYSTTGKKTQSLMLRIALGVPLALFFLSCLLGLGAYFLLGRDPSMLSSVLSGLGIANQSIDVAIKLAISQALIRRLTTSWTALLLGFVFAISVVTLLTFIRNKKKTEPSEKETWIFVILLIAIGSLLVLGPEFLYLKDTFGTRMNTVFKFYFATWILWSIAAAYATIALWSEQRRRKALLRALIVILLLFSALYVPFSIWTKTNGLQPLEGRTLDGMAYMAISNPAEYQAIQWINANLGDGIIAEAVGGSYTTYARISTHTGLATVLGWPGHELQWRGGYAEQGSRMDDIASLYETRSWEEARDIVLKYGINYVYIGSLERNTYKPLDERKFHAFMDVLHENDEVIIFGTR
jgi:YYY domain-containing protein